jgi:hypothetical protein
MLVQEEGVEMLRSEMEFRRCGKGFSGLHRSLILLAREISA